MAPNSGVSLLKDPYAWSPCCIPQCSDSRQNTASVSLGTLPDQGGGARVWAGAYYDKPWTVLDHNVCDEFAFKVGSEIARL
jgi:hypothetical protein